MIQQEFINNCVTHINEYTKRIENCLALLSEEQVWQQPNAASNSIANLILHLCGNMTQYVLSGLGELPDNRKRDQEFETKGGFTKAELIHKLNTVVEEVIAVIEHQTTDSLLQTRTVQGFTKTGMAIVLHITEHYSYHTGQIALLTKLMTNKDLGFYKGYNLNQKNQH
jgi:uncharacterized damage-inducible protein DinB